MLATSTHSLPFHSSLSTPRPYPLSCPRSPLSDSTNVDGRPSVSYPTSSLRTGCGWVGIDSSNGTLAAPFYSRYYHLSSPPSSFPATYKAPPTVSISLSAACSQSVPGVQLGGTKAQGAEPDLPDVRSVVPFPSSPLDGDMDVEMVDGTCVPGPEGPFQGPRKRRSAHSSISSSQVVPGKEVKQKRPRKSKRHVVEMWWLGVVHRSISRGIEALQPADGLDPTNALLSRSRDLYAIDRVLVERIQKRLAENGCVEGRSPSPLPRISLPSMSGPSLSLLTPSMKTMIQTDHVLSALDAKENDAPGSTFAPLGAPAPKAPACASLSIISCSSVLSGSAAVPASQRRHVRFEIAQRPRARQAQARTTVARRSPSPPARFGAVSAGPQTLTLTMPQLVASLTLAHREKSRLRPRGRSTKPSAECGRNNAGRFPPVQGERMNACTTLRARLSSAPERRSPLSRVTYAEG